MRSPTTSYVLLDHTGASELVLSSDGSVLAGTLPALVEQLTTHTSKDPVFYHAFFMTFKSFTTIDQVIDILMERYNIQPPEDLTSDQLSDWLENKQAHIRAQSIDAISNVIEGVGKEDLDILERVKTFANEVILNDPGRKAAAKALLHNAQRMEKRIRTTGTIHIINNSLNPHLLTTPPEIPNLGISDIDPRELAHQLTLMENDLFLKISPSEYIQYSKDSESSEAGNIKSLITVTNRITNWVVYAVLVNEDPRKRAAIVEYFINVAEHCRQLANYSCMTAILAGLDSPPVHRLTKTWEQVDIGTAAIFDHLGRLLSELDFSHVKLSSFHFLGESLTALAFIQDHFGDTLEDGPLINFQKYQKMAGIIQEARGFRQRFGLTVSLHLMAFIEESLATLDSMPDLWQISLEREMTAKPRQENDEDEAIPMDEFWRSQLFPYAWHMIYLGEKQSNAWGKVWNTEPSYLQLDHTSPLELALAPDGAVRAATLPALIERLTMHIGTDARLNDTFLMTFKSFSNIDQVFDMLVERYNIQPPEGLTPDQLVEWKRMKNTPIRLRCMNTMRKLIDVIEKEDLHILDRAKTFAKDVISNDPDMVGVAKTLLHIILRMEKNGIGRRCTYTMMANLPPPPPVILPRHNSNIQLLYIDPLELARQLTIMETELFFKIKQSECIARSQESAPTEPNNIQSIITVNSKMADWVACAVLSKEDPRSRAAIIKHFVNVAERCRYLANYSTMAALVTGLSSPPIRRLKRTWEQVNSRNRAILDDLEKALDTAHNFQGYKSLISNLQPPCVPFLGAYLTVLTFICDGAKGIPMADDLIDFEKCQRIANVIQEITKLQTVSYNLTKVPAIRTFIDESLLAMDNVPDLWQLSLEKEPVVKELMSEQEKMAQVLRESGLLYREFE